MKISWLLPLTFLLMAGKTAAQDYTNVQFDLDDVICKEQQRAQGLIDFSKSRNFAADQTDIYYQDMHWEIDPAVNYIKGVITYYFKSRMDNISNLILDLSDALHVNSIQRGSQPLTFTHGADQILTIDLGKQLNTGESDTLTISYEGTPPSNGFGSFVQSTHNNIPVIWTLSEPYGVRDWWPGKQDLVDKVDSIDTYITTPPGQLAAGNGKLISITEENGKLVHHWRHRHPIASYLI
ncbi:MAG TPA: hypothetical protein VJ508_07335, partial [Saprospiraceae bacterium]|nr:hypothetical protein [Saprospiraceae bacterium]